MLKFITLNMLICGGLPDSVADSIPDYDGAKVVASAVYCLSQLSACLLQPKQRCPFLEIFF